MKYIFAALTLGFVLLASFAASITGFGIMIADVINYTDNFFQGFLIFSLGTIMFFVTIAAYQQVQILTNTKIIAQALAEYMEHQMKMNSMGQGNPLASLFSGGFPMSGTMKMARIDESGNIVPFMEKNFNSPEEFLKYRNELLSKAFGYKPEEAEKKLEELSVEELKFKEKEASDSQNFELAAAIRDLIAKKNKQ